MLVRSTCDNHLTFSLYANGVLHTTLNTVDLIKNSSGSWHDFGVLNSTLSFPIRAPHPEFSMCSPSSRMSPSSFNLYNVPFVFFLLPLSVSFLSGKQVSLQRKGRKGKEYKKVRLSSNKGIFSELHTIQIRIAKQIQSWVCLTRGLSAYAIRNQIIQIWRSW